MRIGRRLSLITLSCLLLVLSIVSCGGDDDYDCCDLLHGTKDWLIDVDFGYFDDGLAEIERPVVNGLIPVTVLADQPAVYTLRVQVPGDTTSATIAFSVGL
jgi:hypothetical protein